MKSIRSIMSNAAASLPDMNAIGGPSRDKEQSTDEFEITGDAEEVGKNGIPKILLMGMRNSGKSSIRKVIFHKMYPNETLFLKSTIDIEMEEISESAFMRLRLWDFPGEVEGVPPSFADAVNIFRDCNAIVFVYDSGSSMEEALFKLGAIVQMAYRINPNIFFDVFIHKCDELTNEQKLEIQNDFYDKWQTDVSDLDLSRKVEMAFYLTSLYDYTAFDSFSKVVQKLIPQTPYLERILTAFSSSSSMTNTFIFDVATKIYVANDSNPVKIQDFELCSETIELILDLSSVYSSELNSPFSGSCRNVIKFSNSLEIYVSQVHRGLAAVGILVRPEMQTHGVLIDYNIEVLRKAVHKIIQIRDNFSKSTWSSESSSIEELDPTDSSFEIASESISICGSSPSSTG